MATALAAGAIDAQVFQGSQLIFVEPSEKQREVLLRQFPESEIASESSVLLSACEQVILAVKPHILKEIAGELAAGASQKNLFVSIAAGISLANLRAMLATKRVIRVMPNTPCQVGEGASGLAADEGVSKADLDWARQLMESVGLVEQVPDQLMHAVTGVSGSSPAYLYLVIEALSDGGVAQGLPRAMATKLAAQAVVGAGKMVLESGLHPGALKDQVTSPGGTTIAALRELEASGVRSAFIEAVAACAERSEELG